MAFSSGSGAGAPMAEINVTPLVDVMLVLLIIFMITAPLMQHKIRIDLPQATINQNPETPPDPIDLAIKEDGSLYWNDSAISDMELKAQLAVTAQRAPQPELQIRAEKATRYEIVAKVMADAKNQGMVKIGFVTTPAPRQ
ncbi:MAG TPA: biopolymer transporter ExbD [Tahibacter sp.]|jgi:biopolymer transport protein ExbD|uniref:Biopolymer transporter ExbD n=1 Tax=Tahibacter soli TaxID=2983605 RepID=A0A9X3YL78_9GAMM|nr:biopolymer transporter ExbD [Tahibacter soli]MDC8014302.1 biopolymer transporter ExbD [Tahibacter soli]HVJ61187.1 biopolymer transporter ExbD [Tahibacter sp.]